MSAALAVARAELEVIRQQPGFDESDFHTYGDAERFSARHRLNGEQFLAVLRDTRPKASSDRFKWHAAVIRDRRIAERGLRVAGALFGHAGPTGYCWPSQASLARATSLDERTVRRVLKELAGLGVIRRVRAIDLPQELASIALGGVRDGGSGRSYRGGAYVLVPPADWTAIAVTGLNPPSDNRAESALYNHQDEPEPASQDSFTQMDSNSSGTVPFNGTVPRFDEGAIQNCDCCSEPHAREGRHDAA
ncbi:helix-turn-helix domain-containing protein [Ancylobacter oerskovii]|uniref:Helix-turn-helix domain-containing protein n=1 Tax=Ancylobacter oerskovii TaxID=459519 RepID=A0ABW4YR37_9HYPH|nr:helix-turn-helix domain-containing protein [Ancylobacter oerskovii]MBS7545718.1 helix-turn-helix domain-containing protein [Ancylobacter oerskovii]